MSRRFQTGSIEKSGKWYGVRYWVDVAGEDKRRHACSRICPIQNPGSLTKAERLARANQIITAAGVNDSKQFVPSPPVVTFREQAKMFISSKLQSKRKPLKPASLCTFLSCIRKLNDGVCNLGGVPLSAVNNAAMKPLVRTLTDESLSPKTILNYTGLVKQIVGSAINDEGEQLFPRKWNSEFMDLPIVKNQHQPTFSAQAVTLLVSHSTGRERMLYALLAGTGMRAGEALGWTCRMFRVTSVLSQYGSPSGTTKSRRLRHTAPFVKLTFA